MRQTPRILVVHEDAATASRLAAEVAAAGGTVEVATTFEDGKKLLAEPPALLIAGVRLGAYNGLHLVIRGRLDDPMMSAVVIADEPNPTFEAEVVSHGAAFMVGTQPSPELLSLVAAALAKDAV
jgi:DNA-binding response OmpR family regulator